MASPKTDIQIMETILETSPEREARLLEYFSNLEEVMTDLQIHLHRSRTSREEWFQSHNTWKENFLKDQTAQNA